MDSDGFDFKEYKFREKVNLDDIHQPEVMFDMFESIQAGNTKALKALSRTNSVQTEGFDLEMEPTDIFKEGTVQLAEIELEDL